MASMVHDVHSLSPLFIGSENNVPSDEQEMVRRLTDARFNGRDDALEWLKASIRKCDGSRVPFSDSLSVFQGLSIAVEDDEWDTRYQCVKVIGDLIPLLDTSDIEQCMHELLPQMVHRLADTKITVSTATVCALCTYAEYTTDIQILYDAIVRYGLKADGDKLRQAVIEAVPSLLEASRGRRPNLKHLIASLIELTFDTHFLQPVETCLHKITLYLGMAEFDACINQLPISMQEQYSEIQDDRVVRANTPDFPDVLNGMSADCDSPEDSTNAAPVPVVRKELRKSHTNSEKTVVLYGFVPSRIVNSLSNRDDSRSLSRAVEELRAMVSDSENVAKLQPHMSDFLNFLGSLLDDGVSFQVLY